MNINNLNGKHALVTGGTRGIGLAIAQMLLEYGAKVTIVARNAANLKKAVAQLSHYGTVDGVELDVTDSVAVPVAFNSAVNHFGPISILINNAGQFDTAPFLKTDLTQLHATLSANLDGLQLCTQAVLPDMVQAGWGRIINVASTAGLTGYADSTAYCAAKHAVVGLTRALALEAARQGVTVNAICPGFTETESVQQDIADAVKNTKRTAEQIRAEFAANNPQGRLVQVAEVAHAVTWLCMPLASAINGQAIAVDGGELI